ncbi:tyrosine-protein kinase Dnt-like [Chironomus tepperi]|uniref:tyrosine-protein kinase Dnt-like n=1 Tax=Chironomus tepperi TaxID=113505 RepID=UPI00391EF8C3
MSHLFNAAIIFGLYLFVSTTQATYNLYLNEYETMRLLGLSAEMYYVRDGHINKYALQFTVPVAANINDIVFTWQSLAGRTLPYRINIATADPIVLPRPQLNISRIGEMPQEIETFSIEMKCSGIRSGEVEVTISIEITLNRATNNVTELVFTRKKICLQNEILDESMDNATMFTTIPKPSNDIMTLIVGGFLATIVVVLFISIAYCARKPAKRKPHVAQPARTSSFQRLQAAQAQSPSICPTTPRLKCTEPEELQRRIAEITVERCRVRLSSLLQEGTFGRVYRGTYNDDQDVLVKTVGQQANEMQVSLLLQEGMNLYGALHENILAILGVSIEDHTAPFLLYPAENNTKNLKLFLQEPVARTLTTIQIVRMSSELAGALCHLHAYGVIHKDIATRNCVIDDDLSVKLTDHSLSRDLFPQDYHCLGDRENRPIKWLSLEALSKKQFSEASDAWAFGVLIWELCTLAKQPYIDIDAFEMENYLRDGYRLAQPLHCPDELFTIMAYCWAVSTFERPTSQQLQLCLLDFYNQLTHFV